MRQRGFHIKSANEVPLSSRRLIRCSRGGSGLADPFVAEGAEECVAVDLRFALLVAFQILLAVPDELD